MSDKPWKALLIRGSSYIYSGKKFVNGTPTLVTEKEKDYLSTLVVSMTLDGEKVERPTFGFEKADEEAKSATPTPTPEPEPEPTPEPVEEDAPEQEVPAVASDDETGNTEAEEATETQPSTEDGPDEQPAAKTAPGGRTPRSRKRGTK